MKSSNIGGQAVLEGIMMKNKNRCAVAVRRPNGQIAVEEQQYQGILKNEKIKKIPFVRGIFAFIDSMVLGITTLNYSANIYMEEEEQEEPKKKESGATLGLTVILSLVIAIGLFTVLPSFIAGLFKSHIHSYTLRALVEGGLKLIIFLGYLFLISRMKDIQRLFMYHGAEHKCINCIERGLELNVGNVRKSSRQHKRCGTSFLLFVILLSIIVGIFIHVDAVWLRVLIRLALLPLVAGVSYELIKWAGNSDNPVVCMLSKPGLMVQKLTTSEPEDDMIEVGIQAVESVFDWKKWQQENKEYDV